MFFLIVLTLMVFGYHRMVVQQNRRAHHEQLGEATGRLAVSSAFLLADYLTYHSQELKIN